MDKRIGAGLAVLAAVLVAGTAAAQVTPRLWGTSYARVLGPTDTVLGFQNRAVHVSVRMPRHLECTHAVQTEVERVPLEAVQRDPMAAAPVDVVLERGACRGSRRDRWVDFVVRGAGTDILDIGFVTADGERLGRQRVAVETTSGPSRP